MNNKGFTISELLVTFVLVMAIVLGLFKLVDHYRERQQNASAIKEITSYKNEVIKTIEDDILFNCGGLKDITPENVTTISNATQVIKITFNSSSCEPKFLATIKDDSNSDSETINSGIQYGNRFFKYPSKFISAVEDIIWEESPIQMVQSKVEDITTLYKCKKFYSIKIGLSHSELNRIFNINISTVVNLDTNT